MTGVPRADGPTITNRPKRRFRNEGRNERSNERSNEGRNDARNKFSTRVVLNNYKASYLRM
jgi:hypothetical protein